MGWGGRGASPLVGAAPHIQGRRSRLGGLLAALLLCTAVTSVQILDGGETYTVVVRTVVSGGNETVQTYTVPKVVVAPSGPSSGLISPQTWTDPQTGRRYTPGAP